MLAEKSRAGASVDMAVQVPFFDAFFRAGHWRDQRHPCGYLNGILVGSYYVRVPATRAVSRVAQIENTCYREGVGQSL